MNQLTDVNPLAWGPSDQALPSPCSLVILGGAGDLARRKLLPAVYNLALDGALPTNFLTMGFSRQMQTDDSYRALALEHISLHSRRPVERDGWPGFAQGLFYTQGGFDDPSGYQRLAERLAELEPKFGVPGSRVFYLSIPPQLIATCLERLRAAGLLSPPAGQFARVIVEKPIGNSLATAQALEQQLASVLDESQIFRIDHYLGKETVQNIMVMRFANAIFEPLWNQKYVDHVQITVAEEEGVGTRAGYYEGAGALRDMVQNHILQLLCLTAMDPPWTNQADVVRDRKLEILRCLRPLRGDDVPHAVVRAQYGPGFHHGSDVPGYRREDGVRPDSTTETYVALKVLVDNWRWAGVPFYLRTGKRLPKRASEIAVQFKAVPEVLFNTQRQAPLEPNVLALRIQPDEGLSLRISTKTPGTRVRIYPVKMDFRYGSTFGEQSPEAYERLLLDVMAGDATLFMRRDAVEASWAFVDEILAAWRETNTRWLPEYASGTWGPVEADRLIAADGRCWRTL